jgi:hypothetical protein
MLLNLSHGPAKRPLPFVNLTHDGGISDLNHPPQLSCRIYVAPRSTQQPGIVIVSNDKEPAIRITPQFDDEAL